MATPTTSSPQPNAAFTDDAATIITIEMVTALMNAKAQPPGALGHVQQVAIQLCVLQQSLTPTVHAPVCLVFAGDHGITKRGPADGPSAFPREVTELMYKTVCQGRAAVTVMATALNIPVACIDVGIDSDRASSTRVARGTLDMTAGPAMSLELCQTALQVGRRTASRYINDLGHNVICVGELGIGNTTSASALVAAVTNVAVEDVCGRGTGLDDDGVLRKVRLVQLALATNAQTIQDDGVLGALAAVGGLEIAAMCGAMLEAGRRRVPVIVDGFISGAAALVALRLEPDAMAHALFLSHQSEEKGASILLHALGGLGAPLHMNMRLGEGTGAVLCVPILQCAAKLVQDMASLQGVIEGTVGVNPASDVATS
ncbi:hypothetical protein B5M09_011139 [Aphanomyces astaci]|uniref:Nicotinate-nucleotide--dimethylbenzimidazole phosphoribosyltransferase n=1 Tax=Aphanomyces astaci TaxID=112090 RepID=A0A3R8DP97_APHAT|nr:hypothetical protein B5M09_011139 [Aphanomyces astaci]